MKVSLFSAWIKRAAHEFYEVGMEKQHEFPKVWKMLCGAKISTRL